MIREFPKTIIPEGTPWGNFRGRAFRISPSGTRGFQGRNSSPFPKNTPAPSSNGDSCPVSHPVLKLFELLPDRADYDESDPAGTWPRHLLSGIAKSGGSDLPSRTRKGKPSWAVGISAAAYCCFVMIDFGSSEKRSRKVFLRVARLRLIISKLTKHH